MVEGDTTHASLIRYLYNVTLQTVALSMQYLQFPGYSEMLCRCPLPLGQMLCHGTLDFW